MSTQGNTASANFENDRKQMFDVLKKNEDAIKRVATKHLTAERLMNLVYGELRRTPKLIECSRSSVAASVIQAARLGLEIGEHLGRAYLVPFKKTYNNQTWLECQLVLGYKGMVELAYRSPQVMAVEAEVVYEGDYWKNKKGLVRILEHESKAKDHDPNKIIAAYSVVRLRNGGAVAKVLDRWEIDAIRATSPAFQYGNGPWHTHYAAMAMKTAIRQGFKVSPASVELAYAVTMEELGEAGFSPEDMIDEKIEAEGPDYYAATDAPVEPQERQEPRQEQREQPRPSVAIVRSTPVTQLIQRHRQTKGNELNTTPNRPGKGKAAIRMPGGDFLNPDEPYSKK